MTMVEPEMRLRDDVLARWPASRRIRATILTMLALHAVGGANIAEVWNSARLATGETVKLAMFGEDASYGFGWFLTSYAGRPMYTHGGGIEGYSANLYHLPDERLTIVVLANIKGRDDGVAPVDILARRIADLCLRRDSCRLPPSEDM